MSYGTADSQDSILQPKSHNSPNMPIPDGKRMRLDPKEIARKRAQAVKAEAKAASRAKEAAGMHKMTAFFKKP